MIARRLRGKYARGRPITMENFAIDAIRCEIIYFGGHCV